MNIICKLSLITWFFVLMTYCKDLSTESNVLETIDIESNIKNFEELTLNNFNSKIQYVPLRGNSVKIDQIQQLEANSDYLLISNPSQCFLFDLNGNLIRKIGEIGRGPHEYSTIINCCFGFDNNVYVQIIGNFIEYGTDGVFKSSFNIKKDKSPFFYLTSWILINDSLFFGQVPLSTGNDSIKAILFDKNGTTKQEFSNYIFLKRQNNFWTSDDSWAMFNRYESKIYFKERMNDTLFCLTDKFKLVPRVSFKIGKFANPKEYRESTNRNGFNPFNYVFVNGVYEISDYLLIDCSFGNHTPARRITPKENRGILSWFNTSNVLGIYSKKRNSLVFIKPSSTDNPLLTTGFYNDIDAGPRFYPFKQLNDSTFVMWIEAKQLKDHVASDDFKNNIPKNPEKKNELENLAGSLSEFDNPVLMFVTFSKNK
jgi:hypothetical protein